MLLSSPMFLNFIHPPVFYIFSLLSKLKLFSCLPPSQGRLKILPVYGFAAFLTARAGRASHQTHESNNKKKLFVFFTACSTYFTILLLILVCSFVVHSLGTWIMIALSSCQSTNKKKLNIFYGHSGFMWKKLNKKKKKKKRNCP